MSQATEIFRGAEGEGGAGGASGRPDAAGDRLAAPGPSESGGRLEAPGDRGSGRGVLKGAERRVRDHESEVRDLHAKIGELIVERDFLSPGPVDEPGGAARDGCARPPGVEPEPAMPPAVGRTFLALLRAEGGERGDARLMRRIDELFLKYPFYGARRMALQPAPRGRGYRAPPGRAADEPDGASGDLSGAA